MATANNSKVKKRGPQIKGIVAAARAIGCTRETLWAVIHRKRFSPLIEKAWLSWKKNHK
jgi:hypothetical protein